MESETKRILVFRNEGPDVMTICKDLADRGYLPIFASDRNIPQARVTNANSVFGGYVLGSGVWDFGKIVERMDGVGKDNLVLVTGDPMNLDMAKEMGFNAMYTKTLIDVLVGGRTPAEYRSSRFWKDRYDPDKLARMLP